MQHRGKQLCLKESVHSPNSFSTLCMALAFMATNIRASKGKGASMNSYAGNLRFDLAVFAKDEWLGKYFQLLPGENSGGHKYEQVCLKL